MAQCGPEGSRRFRLPHFHDIRHVKVVRLSASHTGRLYPQEVFLVLASNEMPLQVAARSKTYVYGRSPAAIVGSNPTQGLDVCLLRVLCVVR